MDQLHLMTEIDEINAAFAAATPPPTDRTAKVLISIDRAREAVEAGDTSAPRLVRLARRRAGAWLAWTGDRTLSARAAWAWQTNWDPEFRSEGWDEIPAVKERFLHCAGCETEPEFEGMAEELLNEVSPERFEEIFGYPPSLARRSVREATARAAAEASSNS